MIALSASSDALLKRLAKSQGGLTSLQLAAALESSGHYSSSSNALALHLYRVIKNNPDKDLNQILARPDVQEALYKAGRSSDKVSNTVNGAHRAGFTKGSSDIRAEAKLLGLAPGTKATYTPSGFLQSVLADVEALGNTHPAAVTATALTTQGLVGLRPPGLPHGPQGPDNINPAVDLATRKGSAIKAATEKEGRKAGNRSAAAATVAASRGYNEAALAELHALQDANPSVLIEKVWVSQLSAATCPSCAALHGQVLSLDGEFDHSQSFAKPISVYGDLIVPPRHPSCRCRIAIYTIELLAVADAMRKDAVKFADASNKMASRAWKQGQVSQVAANSDFMESGDLKAASDSQFESAIRNFRGCIIS